MRKLFATESFEETNAAPIEDISAETEATVGDAVEAGADVTQDAEGMEETVETIDELQDLGDDLGDAEAEGGMTPEAAEQAEARMESICRRLGIPNKNVFPSVEAFGSTAGRRTTTRLAQESVMQKVKDAWQQFVTWVKSTVDKIMSYMKKFLLGAESLKKDAEAMLKKVGELGTKKASVPSIKDSGLVNDFVGTSSTVSASTIQMVLGKHVDLASSAGKLSAHFDKFSSEVEKTIKDIESAGKSAKFDAKGDNSLLAGMVKEIADNIAKSLTAEALKAAGGSTMDGVSNGYQVGPLVGNKRLIIGVSKSGDAGVKLTCRFEENATKNGNDQFPVLQSGDMTAVLNKVIEIAEAASKGAEQSAAVKKIGGDLQKMITAGIKAADAAGGDEGKEAAKALRDAQKAVSGAVGAFITLYGSAPSLNVRAGRAGLRAVAASLKQYKDESK